MRGHCEKQNHTYSRAHWEPPSSFVMSPWIMKNVLVNRSSAPASAPVSAERYIGTHEFGGVCIEDRVPPIIRKWIFMLTKIKHTLYSYTDVKEIAKSSVLEVDYGLSSFDVISIVTEFEDEAHVGIPDRDIEKLTNVKDIVECLGARI